MLIFTNDSEQRGVTLFELLVVLAIISMMAAMASMGTRRISPAFALKNAEDQIVADIRRAQAMARAQNTPFQIQWSTNEYSSKLWRTPQQIPRRVALDATPTEFTAYPDGYSDALTVVLSLGDRSRTLRVNSFSGKILRHGPE